MVEGREGEREGWKVGGGEEKREGVREGDGVREGGREGSWIILLSVMLLNRMWVSVCETLSITLHNLLQRFLQIE